MAQLNLMNLLWHLALRRGEICIIIDCIITRLKTIPLLILSGTPRIWDTDTKILIFDLLSIEN